EAGPEKADPNCLAILLRVRGVRPDDRGCGCGAGRHEFATLHGATLPPSDLVSTASARPYQWTLECDRYTEIAKSRCRRWSPTCSTIATETATPTAPWWLRICRT